MTTLLVASTGGHLKQLYRLHRRFTGIEGPFRWATFDTPQSRSLLDGEGVDFVPFIGGRDPGNVLRTLPHAASVLRQHRVDTVISTGSAVALPFMMLARARGLRCHYVESAARSEGPSMTGRLVSRVPGMRLYSQYPAWSGERWQFRGAVFDSFEPAAAPAATAPLEKVVVSLGTYRAYGFRRLIVRLLEILPAETEVLWQTGDTDVAGLGIAGHESLPEHDLTQAMAEADVTVAHAGVGTALAAFEVGAWPVLVPRRHARGEHVDDHQIQITEELARRDLILSVDADDLTLDHLLVAAGRRVATLPREPPFPLGPDEACKISTNR